MVRNGFRNHPQDYFRYGEWAASFWPQALHKPLGVLDGFQGAREWRFRASTAVPSSVKQCAF